MDSLPVSIYGDGFSFDEIQSVLPQRIVSGFTSNPTLAKASGITDYRTFCGEFAQLTAPLSASIEILSEEDEGIFGEASILASLGTNVAVKIPIVNSQGKSNLASIERCWEAGFKVNITAVFSVKQFNDIHDVYDGKAPGYVSVFAGRIADTGIDPLPLMQQAVEIFSGTKLQVLWASPREVLNIYQAADSGVDVITVPFGFLAKLKLAKLDLEEYSRQTSEMFSRDAQLAGFTLGD